MIENILSEVVFDDGKRVVVIDQLGMKEKYGNAECSQNLYLLDTNGNVIWRVSSNFDEDGNPFTNVNLNDDNNIEAYRWNGGLYSINKETGFATPRILLK
jgi:outer membrane protein assembly factor BamB